MWGVGGLQVHGFCNHKVVDKEAELRPNQTLKSLTCGDLKKSLVVIWLGVTKTEKKKKRILCSSLTYLGKGGRRGGVI